MGSLCRIGIMGSLCRIGIMGSSCLNGIVGMLFRFIVDMLCLTIPVAALSYLIILMVALSYLIILMVALSCLTIPVVALSYLILVAAALLFPRIRVVDTSYLITVDMSYRKKEALLFLRIPQLVTLFQKREAFDPPSLLREVSSFLIRSLLLNWSLELPFILIPSNLLITILVPLLPLFLPSLTLVPLRRELLS